jgi:hypothetical protein
MNLYFRNYVKEEIALYTDKYNIINPFYLVVTFSIYNELFPSSGVLVVNKN